MGQHEGPQRKGSEARYFHTEEELSGDSYEGRVSYLNTRHVSFCSGEPGA